MLSSALAYDEILAERFRAALGDMPNVTEKRMMGGVCFLVIGGADRARDGGGRFMFRLGPDNDMAGHALPGAEPMVHGGRRMRGFFFVDEAACTDDVMAQWLALALDFVRVLPPK